VHLEERCVCALKKIGRFKTVNRVLSATASVVIEQAANNSAHSPSKIYAGNETNWMKTWLAPLLFATSLFGQRPDVRLPDESTGIDSIAGPWFPRSIKLTLSR
jgi:hypothetical protein